MGDKGDKCFDFLSDNTVRSDYSSELFTLENINGFSARRCQNHLLRKILAA